MSVISPGTKPNERYPAKHKVSRSKPLNRVCGACFERLAAALANRGASSNHPSPINSLQTGILIHQTALLVDTPPEKLPLIHQTALLVDNPPKNRPLSTKLPIRWIRPRKTASHPPNSPFGGYAPEKSPHIHQTAHLVDTLPKNCLLSTKQPFSWIAPRKTASHPPNSPFGGRPPKNYLFSTSSGSETKNLQSRYPASTPGITASCSRYIPYAI